MNINKGFHSNPCSVFDSVIHMVYTFPCLGDQAYLFGSSHRLITVQAKIQEVKAYLSLLLNN